MDSKYMIRFAGFTEVNLFTGVRKNLPGRGSCKNTFLQALDGSRRWIRSNCIARSHPGHQGWDTR